MCELNGLFSCSVAGKHGKPKDQGPPATLTLHVASTSRLGLLRSLCMMPLMCLRRGSKHNVGSAAMAHTPVHRGNTNCHGPQGHGHPAAASMQELDQPEPLKQQRCRAPEQQEQCRHSNCLTIYHAGGGIQR